MGSYNYISVIAALCYCFMLLIFLASKKNKLVNSFLLLLAVFLLWTGGSLFMRDMMQPGYRFWYHVSLVGMLMLPVPYYMFVNAFAKIQKNTAGKVYVVLMGICIVINIFTGFFLDCPDYENGAFVYHTNWHLYILFAICAFLVIKIIINIVRACKDNKNMWKQFKPLIIGIIILFAGNVLLVFPIFSGFPIDILSGMINAIILFYVLVKRRLFRLEMLSSNGLGYAVSLLLTTVLFMNQHEAVNMIAGGIATKHEEYRMILFAIIFVVVYMLISMAWKLLVKNVVIRDEIQQAEQLKAFSVAVSKTLFLKETMAETVDVIQSTIDVDNIYIFIKDHETGTFQEYYSNRPLDGAALELKADNPLIQWLAENDEPILYREFKSSVQFKSMWDDEKMVLDRMGLLCCSGIREDDEVVGVILLAGKGHKNHVGYNDLQMLASVTSVASISMKNARLYEKAYEEARTDELTGLLNRKYFYELLEEQMEKHPDTSVVLAIFNVDDFKLYNQLYGVSEGDECLKRIARIVSSNVGDNGYVARYSGKEFAVLLPNYDVYTVRRLAESISAQIYDMNSQISDYRMKAVTVSVGISAAPFSAKTVKELMENVDMAIYHVKHRGKNAVQVFDMVFQSQQTIAEETDHAHIYQAYEATIYALTAAIDAKDHYTFSHSNNVATYAMELARKLGMNEDVVEIIRQAALLHDVGKIGIPEDILNKKGRLTQREYEIIQGHVEASIGIIRHLPSLDYVIPAVIGHHERYDGNGYPRRIAGEDIPATARVLCIADSFDAMTSKRCYKDAFELERTIGILETEAGRQFDPNMVRVFINCLRDGTIKVVEGEYSGMK